jgi:hypothetical protein
MKTNSCVAGYLNSDVFGFIDVTLEGRPTPGTAPASWGTSLGSRDDTFAILESSRQYDNIAVYSSHMPEKTPFSGGVIVRSEANQLVGACCGYCELGLR